MPVGFKMTATYMAPNAIVFPDPTSGIWGQALLPAEPAVGWIQDVFFYNGAALALIVDSLGGDINLQDGNADITPSDTGYILRVMVKFNFAPDDYSMTTMQAALDDACQNIGADKLTAFDSLGDPMTYQSCFVELWSNE